MQPTNVSRVTTAERMSVTFFIFWCFLVSDANLAYLCYKKYSAILLYTDMSKQEQLDCKEVAFALRDTMNAISGKWKLAIVGTIMYGKHHFTEIQRNIPKITPRMLSKELRELEINGVVKRIVTDTIPVTITYELTESGQELDALVRLMMDWGKKHRERQLAKL